ncbi:MAG: hypothetical protein AB1466_02310 [Actinomycetota bacterium]
MSNFFIALLIFLGLGVVLHLLIIFFWRKKNNVSSNTLLSVIIALLKMALAEISVFLVMIALGRIERFVLFLDNAVDKAPSVKEFVQNLAESGAKEENSLRQSMRTIIMKNSATLYNNENSFKYSKWILAQDLRSLRRSLQFLSREGLLTLCSVDVQVNNSHESHKGIKPEKSRKILEEIAKK